MEYMNPSTGNQGAKEVISNPRGYEINSKSSQSLFFEQKYRVIVIFVDDQNECMLTFIPIKKSKITYTELRNISFEKFKANFQSI